MSLGRAIAASPEGGGRTTMVIEAASTISSVQSTDAGLAGQAGVGKFEGISPTTLTPEHLV